MADYTNSKPGIGSVMHPEGATAHNWTYLEPLVTPEKIRSLHLWGIELVGAIKDPKTGRRLQMTDSVLKAHIDEAVSIAELDLGIDIVPKQITEKAAFDRDEYRSFGYLTLKHRPISTIEKMTVAPSNNQDIWTIPLDWIETSYLHGGQLSLMPLTVVATTGTIPSNVIGAAIFTWFTATNWVPAFWQCTYTAGFCDMKLPRTINQLIGIIASQEILSILATTNAKNNSMSLSLDGMSQSVGNAGPEIYGVRYKELQEKRDLLTKKLKRAANLGMFSDNF